MNYWIFQGNPDLFDIDTYLSKNNEIVWEVRQEHLAEHMHAGDEVYMWRAAGSRPSEAGVVAVATMIAGPAQQRDDEASLSLWRQDISAEAALRVRLKVVRRCMGAKEMIKRNWIAEDPILRDLRILKMAANTNYPITASQAQRLALLTRNTGRDWNREECVAALWAFGKTYSSPVSRLPGSPVSNVAMAIGWVVSSVYNKVMNFRSIDPRDPRSGLSSTNQMDHLVWKEFFDQEKQDIKVDALEAEFKRLWPHSSAPQVHRTTYDDFGEAPDDNPAALQSFARKIRKGQPKFRKRLLYLYEGKCAITGWTPLEVLEAAHIHPHSTSGINQSGNGVLLRSDLHALLDAYLINIDTDCATILASPTLKNTPYWELHKTKLRKRYDGSGIEITYVMARLSETKSALQRRTDSEQDLE